MLSLADFIIAVYCLVDDLFTEVTAAARLRRRGFPSALSDSEVITMEVVGEFLGYDTDKGIWEYFSRHWRTWFPKMSDRTRFVRQAADLWRIKQLIQAMLVQALGAFDEPCHILDGVPIKTCHVARAKRAKCFVGTASKGYCAAKKEYFYGLKGHLMISQSGVITAFSGTPANTDERDAAWDLIEKTRGLLLGDKGYIRLFFKQELERIGIQLETPLRKNMRDGRPRELVKTMMNVRRLVETVIGQLTGRLHLGRTHARDLWHFTNRISRKLLAHTIAIALLRAHDNNSLELDQLLAA